MTNIVVAIDFSDITPRLVDEAARLAKCYDARIYAIHVAAPDPDFVGYNVGPTQERQFRASTLHKEKSQLEQISEELRSSGIDTVPLLVQGETARLLLKEAGRLHANTLIMGTHGKGLAMTALLGSTSHEIMRHITCPVLLVPYRDERL